MPLMACPISNGMSLASHYASVLHAVDPKKVVSYMKAKGHLSLLPSVVRILERSRANETTVTVAKKDDVAKHKSKIDHALKAVDADESRRLIVDENVVGGFMVVGNGKAVDRTFRSALVSLYQSIVK